MAGDLSARILHPPTDEEQGKVAAIGSSRTAASIRSTWVTETVSMASVPPDPVPLLVSLKAVDPERVSLLRNGGAGAGDESAAGA